MRKLAKEIEIATGLLLLALILVSFALPSAPGGSEPDPGSSLRHPLGVDVFGRDNLQRLLLALRNSVIGPACSLIIVTLLGVPLGIALALWRGPLERTVLQIRALTDVIPRVLFFFMVVTRFPVFDRRLPAFALLALLFVPSVALSVRNAVFGAFSRAQIRSLLSLPIPRWRIGLHDVLWRGCRGATIDAVLARFVEFVALESVLACFGRFQPEGASLGTLLMPPYLHPTHSTIALVTLFLVVYLPLRIGGRLEPAFSHTTRGHRGVDGAVQVE